MRRWASAWIAGAVLVAAQGARASADYPDALKSDLALSYTPGCEICHHAAAAPVGPADTPFGRSMVARGLAGGDVASMASALDRVGGDGVDSDGDGAQDLDELSWGGDPNHADLPLPTGDAGGPVRYGCAWSRAPADALPDGLAIGALAGLGAWRASRRRRGGENSTEKRSGFNAKPQGRRKGARKKR